MIKHWNSKPMMVGKVQIQDNHNNYKSGRTEIPHQKRKFTCYIGRVDPQQANKAVGKPDSDVVYPPPIPEE